MIKKITFILKHRSHFFIVIMALSLFLLTYIVGNNYRLSYKNTYNNVIELSKNSSIKNSDYLELFFLRHEDILLACSTILENSLKNTNITNDEIQSLLSTLSNEYNEQVYNKFANQKFTGIYAAVDGVLIHGIKSPNDLPVGYNPLDRQWYKEAIAGDGKVVFGEPYTKIFIHHQL